MAVLLMSKIKPQNGVAAMVDAADVEMPDGKRLSELDLSAGTNGKDGKDGVSATHSWNGTTLTITSASGTSSANLKGEKGDKGDTGAAGKDGVNGKDGADGKTPVKGTDYFTASDKAEMVAAVLAALPTAEGGNY